MKFILALILCSQTQQICMPPHQWPELFDSQYDCLMFGYKESEKKMKEIGRKKSMNTTCLLGLLAPHSRLFDNVARLWYGEISSHHYLPFHSLFRVGLSTHTTYKCTTIFHDVQV